MSERLSFREIRESDKKALQELFPHWGNAKLAAKLEKTLGSRKEKRFLALLDEKAVAHLKVSFHAEPKRHTADLSSLVVLPEFRKQGIATQLIKFVLAKMPKSTELVVLQAASDSRAGSIYEKLGFKRYGRLNRAVKKQEGYKDNILMFKALSKTTD